MLYKYSLLTVLLSSIVTVYADACNEYYCKVDGKSVIELDFKCNQGTLADCKNAKGVCEAEGGELWRVKDKNSRSVDEGQKFDCDKNISELKNIRKRGPLEITKQRQVKIRTGSKGRERERRERERQEREREERERRIRIEIERRRRIELERQRRIELERRRRTKIEIEKKAAEKKAAEKKAAEEKAAEKKAAEEKAAEEKAAEEKAAEEKAAEEKAAEEKAAEEKAAEEKGAEEKVTGS